MLRAAIVSLLSVILSLDVVVADDWPQWLGPKRESIWLEDGIIDRIPDSAAED